MVRHMVNMDGMLNVHPTLAHFVLTINFTKCYICMPIIQLHAWIEDFNAASTAGQRPEKTLFQDPRRRFSKMTC